MAPRIDWYASDIKINSPSGIGFFSTGFGNSVAVSEYALTQFITSADGTTQGTQLHNVQWLNVSSGVIDSATSGVKLTQIPNYVGINARFIPDGSLVKVQNAKFRVTHRGDVNANPSGLTAKAAQLIHPDTVQNNNGSGNSDWTTIYGSGVILSLTSSPGVSGQYINGVNTYSSQQHDFYVLVSPSPDSIGSKLFQGFLALEYL